MGRTLIEIPENLKFLVTPLRKLVGDIGRAIAQAGDGRACDYEVFEEMVAVDMAAV